ncbi:MAG: betaine/proline/choline family ABC transporter ATP-binding protein [Pseudomonadota bacterium]|nr:betaine/proline/choline family ABC transporter ATP-binding protein [Pseudomonadota bacterium]
MSESTSTPSPVIICREVWKIFGPNPAKFLEEHYSNPPSEAFATSGYIGAVQDVSLQVQPGEILVIMGLSGSGKSTLVRCLSRLVEATAGEIIFKDTDLVKASEKELIDLRRHHMGMVFQHFALLPHRTVMDNVAFPLEVQGVERGTRYKRAREIIGLVGLSGREDYYPRELSGGQQQRVGIARSLAVEPDVWFLDEPFSALDPLIRREMQDEFLRLQSMLNKTIVFITHDFDEAIRLADRIAIMYEGRIVQLGTAEELITNPATDYVREFTRDVAKGKLLSVEAVMSAPVPGATTDGAILGSDRVSDVAKQVIMSTTPVAVVSEDGDVLGSLSREQVTKVLFSGET